MKNYEFQKDNKTKRFVKKYNDGYGARNSTLTISISEDLKKEVKALAKNENESLSNMVNTILAGYLKENLYILTKNNPVALKDLKITEIRSGRIAKKPKEGQPFRKSFLNEELFKIEVFINED